MNTERDELGEIYRGYAERNRETGRWSSVNPGNRFILEERERVLTEVLRRHDAPVAPARALDLGCGSATLLPAVLTPGCRIGIDLLFERLAPAREAGLDGVACADGAALPFPDAVFDLVILSTVLSSVPHAATRLRIGEEATRVLRPGGAVLWYDMRVPNPANRNIRPLRRSEIHAVFPTLDIELRSATLVPQVARKLGDRPGVYRALSGLRFTRSHWIGVFTKPSS